ncbi:MAG: hypothetical protein KGL31_13010 [candidate division NC10 bacterium]|nr:hypothetical protein [candidate division NC10 bacterium]MDE2322808.1 hypothetical protein [candidate division NC10 bacterium]
MKELGERVIRAARLDESLYEEIKADRRAPLQAALVVILSALAAGVGIVLQSGVGDFFLKTLQAMLEWYIWAFFTCVVGTRLLQEPQTRTDVGAGVRMISFASAPGMIRLLGVIPGIGGFVSGLATVWMLGATIVAVRKALDYTTTMRAVGACVIGWVAQYLIMGVLLSLRDPVTGA